MAEGLLRDPGPRARLLHSGPFRFRLLQAIEPLIERFEPCVWWKLRNLFGFVLCHASLLCVAPAEIQRPGGTRNMAESDTAKARTLYERCRR
jgi:hypothetical protein